MSALEQEIIEKFDQLDPAARQRVLEQLQRSAAAAFDQTTWWAQVEALQQSLRRQLGPDAAVGALGLLDELRYGNEAAAQVLADFLANARKPE